MVKDKNEKLRDLIAGYSDSIRLSDIKALIAVLFAAIMMGTVLQFRALYPWYLTPPVTMTPFMIIFISLLISVYPRFPRAGRQSFPLWRNPDPKDFDFLADTKAELDGLPARCAVLSGILWWKNITLQAAYILSTACLAAAAILLFVAHF
jgi:hypothetical protein